jgi:thiamine-phosphate pyrophosphorylase
VNDDVEIALAVGANGVHLGEDDGDLAAARVKLAGKILGASCYDSLESARTAVRSGADYVLSGRLPSPPSPTQDGPRYHFSAMTSACRFARSAGSRSRMRRR